MNGQPGDLKPVDLLRPPGSLRLKYFFRSIIQVIPFQKLLQHGLIKVIRHLDIQLHLLILKAQLLQKIPGPDVHQNVFF